MDKQTYLSEVAARVDCSTLTPDQIATEIRTAVFCAAQAGITVTVLEVGSALRSRPARPAPHIHTSPVTMGTQPRAEVMAQIARETLRLSEVRRAPSPSANGASRLPKPTDTAAGPIARIAAPVANVERPNWLVQTYGNDPANWPKYRKAGPLGDALPD